MSDSLIDLFSSNRDNDCWPLLQGTEGSCVRVVVFDKWTAADYIITYLRHVEALGKLPKGAELQIPYAEYQIEWEWRDLALAIANDDRGAAIAVHQMLLVNTPSFIPTGALVWISSTPAIGRRWSVVWRDRWHPRYTGPWMACDVSPGIVPPPTTGDAYIIDDHP